jgi:hypothetical protein
MKDHETTIANADLWSKYFQDEWSRWLQPFGAPRAESSMSGLAAGTGARVASWISLVAAGPIAWLYTTNPSPVEQLTPDTEDADDEDLALDLAMSAA